MLFRSPRCITPFFTPFFTSFFTPYFTSFFTPYFATFVTPRQPCPRAPFVSFSGDAPDASLTTLDSVGSLGALAASPSTPQPYPAYTPCLHRRRGSHLPVPAPARTFAARLSRRRLTIRSDLEVSMRRASFAAFVLPAIVFAILAAVPVSTSAQDMEIGRAHV